MAHILACARALHFRASRVSSNQYASKCAYTSSLYPNCMLCSGIRGRSVLSQARASHCCGKYFILPWFLSNRLSVQSNFSTCSKSHVSFSAFSCTKTQKTRRSRWVIVSGSTVLENYKPAHLIITDPDSRACSCIRWSSHPLKIPHRLWSRQL